MFFTKIKVLFTLLVGFSLVAPAQMDIADARTQPEGASVTITGVVTSGEEFGGVRYIQDATAGIAVFPSPGSVPFEPVRGDSVTMTGNLSDFNGLLEIAPITAATIHGQVTLPEPLLISADQVGESLEAQLVKIEDAIFDNGGGVFTDGTTHGFTANGIPGKVFIRSSNPLAGTDIPLSPVTIVGLVAQFSLSEPAVGGYQLLPRDANDLILSSQVFLTSPLVQTAINTSGFTISWETNMAGSTNLRYGLTRSLELGEVNLGGSSTSHLYTFNQLDPGAVYFVQAYTVAGPDTGESKIGVFATESNSSGTIRIYFNGSVETRVATNEEAIRLNGTFEDTIIHYINSAQNTIDFCAYNINRGTIISALNEAHGRGVEVRYVAAEDAGNFALDDLDAQIGMIKGNNQALMHNKFVIFDGDDMNNSWVLTGSTNFTSNNLNDDFNNMVFIQDRSLAQAYKIEFEEMFGSTTLMPDPSASRFGPEKGQNTPQEFIIDGKRLELYFSPSDQTTSKIEAAIRSANSDLSFSILSFTRDDLGQALKDMHDAGVDVKGIIEDAGSTGEELSGLIAHGVDVIEHLASWDNHHKYMIADAMNTASDPIVLTGSHNWSTGAESRNDENTIVIHDATIANLYLQEFVARFNSIGGDWFNEDTTNTGLASLPLFEEVQVFPNPVKDFAVVSMNAVQNDLIALRIHNVNGKVLVARTVKVQAGSNDYRLNLAELPSGTYFCDLISLNSGRKSSLKVSKH